MCSKFSERFHERNVLKFKSYSKLFACLRLMFVMFATLSMAKLIKVVGDYTKLLFPIPFRIKIWHFTINLKRRRQQSANILLLVIHFLFQQHTQQQHFGTFLLGKDINHIEAAVVDNGRQKSGRWTGWREVWFCRPRCHGIPELSFSHCFPLSSIAFYYAFRSVTILGDLGSPSSIAVGGFRWEDGWDAACSAALQQRS